MQDVVERFWDIIEDININKVRDRLWFRVVQLVRDWPGAICFGHYNSCLLHSLLVPDLTALYNNDVHGCCLSSFQLH